jgi:hypothetical protein
MFKEQSASSVGRERVSAQFRHREDFDQSSESARVERASQAQQTQEAAQPGQKRQEVSHGRQAYY